VLNPHRFHPSHPCCPFCRSHYSPESRGSLSTHLSYVFELPEILPHFVTYFCRPGSVSEPPAPLGPPLDAGFFLFVHHGVMTRHSIAGALPRNMLSPDVVPPCRQSRCIPPTDLWSRGRLGRAVFSSFSCPGSLWPSLLFFTSSPFCFRVVIGSNAFTRCQPTIVPDYAFSINHLALFSNPPTPTHSSACFVLRPASFRKIRRLVSPASQPFANCHYYFEAETLASSWVFPRCPAFSFMTMCGFYGLRSQTSLLHSCAFFFRNQLPRMTFSANSLSPRPIVLYLPSPRTALNFAGSDGHLFVRIYIGRSPVYLPLPTAKCPCTFQPPRSLRDIVRPFPALRRKGLPSSYSAIT